MELLTYETLDEDVHHFVLHQSSFHTTKELFTVLDPIWREHSPSEVMRILLDIRESGHLPVNPTYEKMKQLEREYGKRACRIAIISTQSILNSLVRGLLTLLKFDNCFFADGSAAYDWLVSDRACQR